MFVGVARIVVQIPGARSLKDRRAVVRSFKDRVGARLKISVAEVGDPERWQIATFGVAVVSSERARCEELARFKRPVEFTVGARAAVERDEPDVVGSGEGHPGVGVAAAADEQVVVVDTQTQVTQDAFDQAARGGHPAGLRDQGPPLVQLAGLAALERDTTERDPPILKDRVWDS